MASLPASPSPLPLFPSTSPFPSQRPSTSINLSRWNNANARPFVLQHQLESQRRLLRRHDSASNLLPPPDDNADDRNSSGDSKSTGTPSSPSPPSIPGKASKYSKPPHPAFRRSRAPLRPLLRSDRDDVTIGEDGVSYRFEGAPFQFMYSYTETPKAKPVALREPPYTPFGPGTMPRPWTGRAPLPKTKKKLPEFDSFRPPPPGKKGVKSVQSPGPFLAGTGPRYAVKAEEVMGEPLTEEEVGELVKSCMKTTRQLNMGRDGLTHNMLDNIHAHWKRRRVCKIKCKGVCTVDIDNVRHQLEEKTGGKVIYSRGGVIFLFRGRYYNYKTRPRFPLMLWKPSPPVYPRLVQRAPEGLTLEEATEMRKRGRILPPICKLAKNGVYINLVKDVREAFEECELVRIDCKGLHKSDTRKIGAKLKDLVPCVLISFQFEHILVWRGPAWKSSLAPTNDQFAKSEHPLRHKSLVELDEIVDSEMSLDSNGSCSETEEDIIDSDDEESEDEPSELLEEADFLDKCQNGTSGPVDDERSLDRTFNILEVNSAITDDKCLRSATDLSNAQRKFSIAGDPRTGTAQMNDNEQISGVLETTPTLDSVQIKNVGSNHHMDGVLSLLNQAIENGRALILDSNSLDANVVYERAVGLAKSAPPGPIFQDASKRSSYRKPYRRSDNNGDQDQEKPTAEATTKTKSKKGVTHDKKNQLMDSFSDVVPHGSLKVDELAKLLA